MYLWQLLVLLDGRLASWTACVVAACAAASYSSLLLLLLLLLLGVELLLLLLALLLGQPVAVGHRSNTVHLLHLLVTTEDPRCHCAEECEGSGCPSRRWRS